MSREDLLAKLDRPSSDPWDIAIIGGGAVGMGAALDAAARGHRCVLLEQFDFGKGTSSRSTKLIHGGVRYLAQGNVALVRESLHERGLLLRNAPSLVKPLRFIVPCYSTSERWYYWTGMKCYDALAGRLGIERSSGLSTNELTMAVPGMRRDGIRGGVAYYDAQFDDARLLIAVAKKVHSLGGLPLNYMHVTDLMMDRGKIRGLHATDTETGNQFDVHAKVVINATGAFSDRIRKMETPSAPEMISPSQGIHLVVNKAFLGGEDAIMIPKTKDGRVLFAIPWLGRVILGTTDTPVSAASIEPAPLEKEVTYLLEHFAHYFDPAPTAKDVLSVYAGLRPLVRPQQEAGATSKISREHRIVHSAGGLLSVLGGKWTTFRKMAEDVVNVAEKLAELDHRAASTEQLSLEAPSVNPVTDLHCGPTRDQVAFAVQHEFAHTVEDVLARRFRWLLLDARGSMKFAPEVATVLAEQLGHSADWADQQTRQYDRLVQNYLL